MSAGYQTTALASAVALLWAIPLCAQDGPGEGEDDARTADVALRQVYPVHPFLGRRLPGFTSYAMSPHTNYEDFEFPYTTSRRTFYGPLGDRLLSGYDVASWRESHSPEGLESELFKSQNRFERVFNNVMIAGDAYDGWSARAMFGSEIRTMFTPLTLYWAGLNGFRGDWMTDQTRISIVASRLTTPLYPRDHAAAFVLNGLLRDQNPVQLFGAHAERSIGILDLGASYVNVHSEHNADGERTMKGSFPATRGTPLWLAVQIADDSPEDGTGGPQVFDIAVWVNGERRDDIRPDVVLHHTRNTAVGRTNNLTGRFTRNGYAIPISRSVQGQADIFKLLDQPQQLPLFADYLYLKDHNNGTDVSRQTDVVQLTTNVELLPGKGHRADGEDFLIYYFDLQGLEEKVDEVELGFLVGNDYVISISEVQEKGRSSNYENRYRAELLRTIERAPGNVQNFSNVQWVRFDYGWPTGLSVYSIDMHAEFGGFQIAGEYALSREFNRYPNEERDGRRHERHGRAWYLVATQDSERWGLGGELFSMQPDFTTYLMTSLPHNENHQYTRRGFINNTGLWPLVQDNDDHDRFPDIWTGQITDDAVVTEDTDGVFPGKDEDRDGIPDTNRNFNNLPDYVEPFLMFDVESDEYVYGVDLDNNDVPDEREDDIDPEYPYDLDLEGFHLGTWVEPLPGLRLAPGLLRTQQIAGGRESRVDYLRLNYALREPGLGEIRFEHEIKRVHDDIPNETVSVSEVPSGAYNFNGVRYESQFSTERIADELNYRNSLVNRSYVASRVTAFRHLQLVNQVKVEINDQRETLFDDGVFQPGDRLGLLAGVHKTSYSWRHGRWTLTPQFKLLYLRQERRSLGIPLIHEREIMPIFKAVYRMTSRTALKAGMQGLPLPGLAYQFKDLTDDSSSFESRDWALFVTNLSEYFGYDMTVNTGLAYRKIEFLDARQQQRNSRTTSMFMSLILGF